MSTKIDIECSFCVDPINVDLNNSTPLTYDISMISAISTRMIDRIFSGAVTRGSAQAEGKMSYTEFVWFLLAEEDKRSHTSIEYWYRKCYGFRLTKRDDYF